MRAEEPQGFPIHRWRMRNFKSVERAEVDFAPLTVLVGANSSGKSTLIQSILLVAQAAQEGPSLWLPLNGPIIELGDTHHVVFAGRPPDESGKGAGAKARQFEIGADFDLFPADRPGSHLLWSRGRADESRVSWDAAFGPFARGKSLGTARLLSVRLAMETGEEEQDLSFETNGSRRKELEMFSGGRFSSGLGEVLPLRGVLSERPRPVRRFHGAATRDRRSGRIEVRKTAGLVQVGGIPIQHFFEVDRTSVEALEILERLERYSFQRVDPSRPEEYERLDAKTRDRIETEVAHAIALDLEEKDLTRVRRRPPLKPTEELSQFFLEMNTHRQKRILNLVIKTVGKGEKVLAPAERRPGLTFGLERVGNSLAAFLARNVRYLGPLREDPRVVYLPTPGERSGNVGKKGEKSVALLHAHGNEPIHCFYHDDRPPHRCTLSEGVRHWLHFFGIAEAIETELRPRLGLEPHLVLPDVERHLDMTAVGVGVSQIFPVLVMGLHSSPGSVLLMEQPELHLHPALQQRLGDFLLACARSGRQLIVETHSDHLISRLRRRIAEDQTDQLQKSLAVVFAERNEGRTSYRQVEVNRYGGIEEWPKGFFDQAAKESQVILRAGLAKKKQESEKTP